MHRTSGSVVYHLPKGGQAELLRQKGPYMDPKYRILRENDFSPICFQTAHLRWVGSGPYTSHGKLHAQRQALQSQGRGYPNSGSHRVDVGPPAPTPKVNACLCDLVHGQDGRWLMRSSRSILVGAATFRTAEKQMEQRPRQQDVYLHVRPARWTVKPAKPLSFFSKPELLNPPQAPKP